MRYIPLRENPPPEEWRNNAEELTERLKTLSEEQRKNFIERNSNIWRELRDFLSNLSYGKCWYSEAKEVYSYYHVDHFRPKSEYWWLAFDWKNFRLAGQVGNVNKRDKFKVKGFKAASPEDPIEDEVYYLLDPTDENDPFFLFFDESGNAVPTEDDGFNKKRAEYTIDILNLNFPSLKEARQKKWIECKSLIDELNQLIEIKKQLLTREKIETLKKIKELIIKKIRKLSEMVSIEEEFSAVVFCCLISHGINISKRRLQK